MKNIDKSILPEGYTTDKDEDGFYAEFYEDGQLAHYAYYVDGELDDRWALYVAEGTCQATVQRNVVVSYETEEEESNNGHRHELSEEQEDEFSEFVQHWVARIHEDKENPMPRCSFCEKTSFEVRKLIAGPVSYICNECVELCQEILAAENEEE